MTTSAKLSKKFTFPVLLAFLITLLAFNVLSFKEARYFFVQASAKNMPLKTKIEPYKDFIAECPDYISPRLKLARYYIQLASGDPERDKYLDSAVKEYQEILKKDPGNKEALLDLGNVYSSRKEDIPKAEDAYKQLIKLYPENSLYRVRLATYYYLRGMSGEALNEIKKAIIYDPEDGSAYFWAAFLYSKYGAFAEAVAAAKEAIRIFEAKGEIEYSLEARFLLGRIYFKTKRVFDSMQEFERIIKTDPGAEGAYIELAGVYQTLGLNDKALATLTGSPVSPEKWDIAFERRSNMPRVRKAIICNIMGWAYAGKSDYMNALKYFRQAKNYGVNYKEGFFASLEKLASIQQTGQKTEKQLLPSPADENAAITKAALGDLDEKLFPGNIIKGRGSDIAPDEASLEAYKNIDGSAKLPDFALTEKYSSQGEKLHLGGDIEDMTLPRNKKAAESPGQEIKPATKDPENTK